MSGEANDRDRGQRGTSLTYFDQIFKDRLKILELPVMEGIQTLTAGLLPLPFPERFDAGVVRHHLTEFVAQDPRYFLVRLLIFLSPRLVPNCVCYGTYSGSWPFHHVRRHSGVQVLGAVRTDADDARFYKDFLVERHGGKGRDVGYMMDYCWRLGD